MDGTREDFTPTSHVGPKKECDDAAGKTEDNGDDDSEASDEPAESSGDDA